LVNSTDSSYNTPLHLAAENGNIEAVDVLLQIAKKRIKVNAKNGVQKTPMLLAASRGHIP
jgi:ankyrin repeat protein